MINVVCGIRSTGRICTDLATALEATGHEVKIAYGRENVPKQFQKYAVRIGSDLDVKLHGVKARLFDGCGFGSKKATEKFIEWVKEYDPDVIHLHNIHGYYINVEVLFEYLKICGKRIIWSFYDCWSFTGHCAHYDFNECKQWKRGCKHCKFLSDYPKTFVSRVKENYTEKKRLFTGIPHLNIVAPSTWMKKQIMQSFMHEYPIYVLPNGLDISKFKKDELMPEILTNEDRFIVLGVSSFWNTLKGLDTFNRLADILPEEEFCIVLVGKIANVKMLNNKIIHIDATDSINQLCMYYSAADVFVNPTLQETQGLTTVEAFACGTPAVVYESGGTAECVTDACGRVVNKNDIESIVNVLMDIKNGLISFSEEDILNAARSYDNGVRYVPFLELYKKLCSEEGKRR